MRIVYLIMEDLTKHPGLSYKISGQIRRWQKWGYYVYQMRIAEGFCIDPNGDKMEIGGNFFISPLTKFSMLRNLASKYRLAAELLKIIKPDLTYSRYLFPAPNVGKIHKYAGKLVFEINSDDRAEYLNKSKVTGIYNVLFRYLSLRNANALIFVTKELANSTSFENLSKQRTVIANGVDTSDFDFIKRPGNDAPNLVFIGSPGQDWHGLDKILFLAQNLKNCIFHIVGPSESACRILWDSVSSNVIFHGYLSSKEASSLVGKMDVGIGTLALHRKRMYEACPLKVRQYLAQGIPIIAASKDTDIKEIKSFYLELPNMEDNVASNIDKIRDFVCRAHNTEELRLEARKFAENHLSFDNKEAHRLHFFDKVVKE